jgi:hypothetical protein
MKCAHPDCERGPATGHALHRISPKGEDFVGLCTEHMRKEHGHADPIAVLIEDHNHGRTR